MGRTRQLSSKIKKKHWFKVFAPKIFREAVIGESYVTDKELLMGRHITSNLMALTNDMKKQNTNIKFKITAIRPEGVTTEVVCYETVPASIKRMVKRSNTIITDSFLAKTKDNVTVRIKPLVFTRTKSKGSVSTLLRKALRSALAKKVSTLGYYDLINSLITYKVQKSLKEELNKIYPIRISEIKSMKKVEGEVAKEAPTQEEPVPEKKKQAPAEAPKEAPAVEEPAPKKKEEKTETPKPEQESEVKEKPKEEEPKPEEKKE